MPTFSQRPRRFGAAELRTEAERAPRAISLPDTRTSGATARVEAKSALAAVVRPINLERRARFARIEADAPRGA